MGPALLPTPLSPACGPPKGYLAPGVSSSGRGPKARFRPNMSPGARAGAGTGFPCREPPKSLSVAFHQSETGLVLAEPRAAMSAPECFDRHRPRISPPAYPMIAAFVLNGPVGVQPASRPSIFLSSFKGDAIIASKPFLSLLYQDRQAVLRGGDLPSSIIGECAWGPSRARARASTYPLSARMPVDKGG